MHVFSKISDLALPGWYTRVVHMALMMTRPWKHPKTGIYWLRKRVPGDLRPVLGRLEEKQSLKTRDPEEAKRLLSVALVKLDRQWANLRAGPRILTERQAHDLARGFGDRWLDQNRDYPGEQTFWRTDLYSSLWRQDDWQPKVEPSDWTITPDTIKRIELEQWCEAGSNAVLTDQGLSVDAASRLRVAKAVAAAIQRASLLLAKMALGYGAEESGGSAAKATVSVRHSLRPVLRFQDLIDGWSIEKKPAEKTVYEWRRVFRQLALFLGHDDAEQVSAENLIAWKESLLAAGRRSKTIRDAHIAPVRAVFRWAVNNRRLAQSPAERVTIDVKIVPSERKRSFTDEEAKIIISAARREVDPVRHWIPMLCAYSGARVSEICQLRREDVIRIGCILCLKFDPDAGSLKTMNSERTIPVHPALLELGFEEFAYSIKKGPIFSGLAPDKFGKRGGNGIKILGRWVRSLGLIDTRLSPNHSWRHRMKTLARRHGLAPDIIDAITGHGRRTIGDAYGEYEVSSMFRELKKIPAIDFD